MEDFLFDLDGAWYFADKTRNIVASDSFDRLLK